MTGYPAGDSESNPVFGISNPFFGICYLAGGTGNPVFGICNIADGISNIDASESSAIHMKLALYGCVVLSMACDSPILVQALSPSPDSSGKPGAGWPFAVQREDLERIAGLLLNRKSQTGCKKSPYDPGLDYDSFYLAEHYMYGGSRLGILFSRS